jgi:RHS repeat-associated protein
MSPTIPADQDNLQRTVLLATDNKNSVLAEVAADNTNPLAYSAYGHQSARHEVNTHLGFNGELHEAQTSWYLLGNGYRAYNPRLMRFHSPDSLSPFGLGGLNAYMYCVGDPINRSDPTGHVYMFLRDFFANLLDVKTRFTASFQAQRAAGQSSPVAVLAAVQEQMPNVIGSAAPVPTLGGTSGKSLVSTKKGWLNQKVGGVPSSTPDPGSNASLPGSSSGWNNWGSGGNSYASNAHLQKLQAKSDAHPRSTNKSTSSSNTSTGAPSSYSSGSHNNPSPSQRIQSSSSPYQSTPPNLDTSNKSVRQKK